MKLYKILTTLIVMIMMASFANALVDTTFHASVDNVEVYAFDCTNADCSTFRDFSGSIPSYSTTNGKLNVIFPSTLATSHGYALFFVSEGYLPKEAHFTYHSHGNSKIYYTDYTLSDFNRVEDCQAVVDQFEVVNDAYANEPLTIDVSSSLNANVSSAFTSKFPYVNFVPEVLKDYYYSADVVVELEIVNENGDRVNLQEKNFTYANGNPIYMDESAEASFSWLPVRDGRYIATVTSTVTDAQCINSLESSASKEFPVLPARPTNECYTLMNNLDINNSFPMVGDDLMFTFEKLSNYAGIDHTLYPIATDITYEIYEGATLVDSGSLIMDANANTFDAESYSFNYVPTKAGQMRIVVKGEGSSVVCNGLNNSHEILSLNFNVADIPTYEAYLQFADESNGNMIEGVEVTLNNEVGYTNSMGLVTFEDLNIGVYTFTASASGYEDLQDSIEVIDGDIGQSYLMTPIAKETLNVDIECFETTIVGHEQSCSVYVTDSNNNIVPDSQVEVRYEDGDVFGRCTTDTLSGGCVVEKVEDVAGEYKVRAKATHPLHLEGTSSWFKYEVFEERYDIINLKVFEDVNFTNERYVFYRGEDMYVSFDVVDQIENFTSDLISSSTLVSPAGGRAELTFVEEVNGNYKFKLTPIPITHDFIGQSDAYAFVFDFKDNTGGQESVELTILNNQPFIFSIPDQTIAVGELKWVDLAPYFIDKEDGNDLRVDVETFNGHFTASEQNYQLQLVGISKGVGDVKITITDLDGDSDTESFTVTVTDGNVTNSTITFTNYPPTVAYVDELYSFDLDAVSDEGIVLFTLIDAPIGFTMTSLGFMQWTPTEADLGLHSVTVQANDGVNTLDLTWTIEVKDTIVIEEEEELDEQLDVVKIRFPYGEVVSPGEELRVSVTVDNSGDVDFEDVKLTVMSYDLQERRSVGPFDIDEGDVETKSVSIMIPSYTPKGEYDIRIVVRSDDIKRVKHRTIKVI